MCPPDKEQFYLLLDNLILQCQIAYRGSKLASCQSPLRHGYKNGWRHFLGEVVEMKTPSTPSRDARRLHIASVKFCMSFESVLARLA